MITTTGTLQLGDTAVTDMSIYGFDRSGSSESLLSIHGASSVTFSTSATTVYANLYVSTAGNVAVNTALHVPNGYVQIFADNDANLAGSFTVAASTTITVSLALTSFSVSCADVVIGNGASLALSTASVSISSTSTLPIQFGGSSSSGTWVDISSTEAASITTSTSWKLISKIITIRALSSGTVVGSVELDARVSGGQITFSASSVFDSLNATAEAGLAVNAPITTIVGQLALDGDYDPTSGGRTAFAASATLSAKTNLLLCPRSRSAIDVVAPATWSAQGNVQLYTGVRTTGSGSTLSILADSAAAGSGQLIFAGTANISVQAPVVSTVYLRASAMQWSTGFRLSASSATVVIDKSTSSAFSVGVGGALTDAMLLMVTTTGVLQVGDTLVSDLSVVGFDRSTRSESLLSLRASNSVTFSTSATTVYANLYVSTAGNVAVNTALHVPNGYVQIFADNDANLAGSFTVAASTTITVSLALTSFSVSCADVVIGNGASLALSTASVSISSTSTLPIQFGGSSSSGTWVDISSTEAASITTSTSWKLISKIITIRALSSGTVVGSVELDARVSGGQITFSASSVFDSLNATAEAGLAVNAPITTIVGQLALDGDYDPTSGGGRTAFAASATLSAKTNLLLCPRSRSAIDVVAPATWSAQGNVQLYTGVRTTGSGSTLSILADSAAAGSGQLIFAGTANISVQAPVVSTVYLRASAMQWSTGFRLSASSATVVIDKSTSSAFSVGVGGALTDAMLLMVTTTGVLQVGDTLVSDLSVVGFDRSTRSESLLSLRASNSVTFSTSATTVYANLYVSTAGNVAVNTALHVPNGYVQIFADNDANLAGSFTVAASTTITVSLALTSFSVSCADVVIGNGASLALSTASVSISSTSTLPIQFGGSSSSGTWVDISSTEAASITTSTSWKLISKIITIRALSSGTVVGSVELDARVSGGQITFSASSVFDSLNATAEAGLAVNAPITTIVGQLALDGDYDPTSGGRTAFAASATLSAKTNLLLCPRSRSAIDVVASATWSAQGNVQLYTGVRTTGSGSTLSILADSAAAGSGQLIFAGTANISVQAPVVSTVYLRASAMQWSTGFRLSASSATVVIDKSTSSAFSVGVGGALTDAMLLMVTTTGVLQVGDTLVSDLSVVGFDRSTRSESLLSLRASNSVTFSTSATTVYANLYVSTAGNVAVNTALHVPNGYVQIFADNDANLAGSFTVAASTTITVSLALTSFSVSCADVVIGNGASLALSTASVSISSTSTLPIQFGGSSSSGTWVDISSTEAASITTSTSWKLISKIITIRALSSGTVVGSVELDARVSGGQITFSASSVFDSLNATAEAGLAVNAPITTIVGQLALDGDYDPTSGGRTAFAASATLSAKTNLLLCPRSRSAIDVVAPATWSAQGNVQLYTGVRTTGSGSTLSILADSAAAGSGQLIFAGTANISVQAPVVSTVYLRASAMQWSTGFRLSASSATVVIDKSTSSAFSVGVGGALTDAMLLMVTTTGVLQVGDTLVSDLSVVGFDRSTRSESRLSLRASNSVTFSTSATTVYANLYVSTAGNVAVNTALHVPNGYVQIFADNDANLAGSFTVAASTTITVSLALTSFSVSCADVVIGNGASLALSTASVSISSTSTLPIQFGGSSSSGTWVDISSTEAASITTSTSWKLISKIITIRALSSGTVVGSVELDARVSGGQITFSASSVFDSLNATAEAGLAVNAPITTIVGQLALDGDYDPTSGGRTAFAASATLSAKTNLLLCPRSRSAIDVVAPATWSAQGNVQLYTGVRTTGSGSTLSILADSAAAGSGQLIFAGTANISVQAPVVSTVYLRASAMQWSTGFRLSASSATVVIDKSTSSAFSVGVGGALTDAMLLMVTTTGVLQVGDTLVSDLSVVGFDRSTRSESLLSLRASNSVTFSTSATTVYANLYVSTAGNVAVNTALHVPNGYVQIFADNDANLAGSFTVAASTTITVSLALTSFSVSCADVVIGNGASLALSTASVSISSTSTLTIQFGCASFSGSCVYLSCSDLASITTSTSWKLISKIITIRALSSGTVVGSVELDARVSGRLRSARRPSSTA
ncbi:Uncharacterized protein PBTT_06243 [Plasmodiophora brassicae]